MRGWRTITSVVRTPCVSCSGLAATLCALRLSYTSQKTQANCKENEHFENSLRQSCDPVFRTAVLRCSILHREAAVRNPEICRRGQVHGCRKADVTQAIENEHVENSLRQPCDLVFRRAVLRCCSQHREAAIRNQEICRRR